MRLPGPLTQRKHSALEPFAVFTPGDKASKNLRFSGDQQQVLLTLVGLSGEEARRHGRRKLPRSRTETETQLPNLGHQEKTGRDR